MSTYTTNLSLEKPASDDNVSLSVINGNYDKIDQFAGSVPDIEANPQSSVTQDLITLKIGSTTYSVASSTVSGLSDVAITSATTGQVLKFNSTSGKWENGNESGGSVSLNDLTDTALATPTNGQALTYNSTSGKWVNTDLPTNDGETIHIATNVTYSASFTGSNGTYVATLSKYVDNVVSSTVTLQYTDLIGNTTTKDLDDVQIGYDTSGHNTYLKALDDTICYNNNYFHTGDTIISALVESQSYSLTLMEEVSPTAVSWSQTVSTGTKIATVTINNVATDVYAPGGGSSALSGLSDVSISSVSDGQFLTYDSTSSKWNNESVALGDTVNVSQIQSTGTKIATVTVNGTGTDIYAPTSGGATSLSGLSDVDLTTPSDGQVLTYDNANSKWINANASGGTTVIANPAGTPTDDLETIQIGNDIYSIPSGGGGNSVFTGKSLVMKTKTYTGDGNSSLSVTFTEKPVAIYNIFGDGLNQVNKVLCLPFVYGDTTYVVGSYALGGNGMLWNSISYSNNDLTMTMTASDAGAAFNNSGSTYTIWYLVEQNFNELKDLTGTLTTGSTSITLSDSSISADSTIEIFNSLDVPYNSKTIDTTTTPPSITVTFDAQESDMTVKVRVS